MRRPGAALVSFVRDLTDAKAAPGRRTPKFVGIKTGLPANAGSKWFESLRRTPESAAQKAGAHDGNSLMYDWVVVSFP